LTSRSDETRSSPEGNRDRVIAENTETPQFREDDRGSCCACADRLRDALIEVDIYLANDPDVFRLVSVAKAGEVIGDAIGWDTVRTINERARQSQQPQQPPQQPQKGTTTMTTTTAKPKWVEALEESERVLHLAEKANSENGERDALIRLAATWQGISDRYKDSGS
jgi:hypothetical protein